MTPLPRWPARLLRAALPPDHRRAAILGDLHEEYAHRAPGIRRTLSFSAVCLRLAVEYIPARFSASALGGALSFEAIRLDVSHAAASLRRSRTYTLASFATLTIGIAAVTAILTIAYGALMRPLPFRESQQLLRFGTMFPSSTPGALSSMSPANILDVARRATRFSDVGIYNYRRDALMTASLTENVLGVSVSGNFLTMLGSSPIAGRILTEADDAASSDAVIVIGERVWTRFFARAPSAIGARISVNLQPYTIVGIVSDSTYLPAGPEYWTTFRWDATTQARRNRHDVDGIARLRAGATFEQGREELRAIGAELVRSFPAENKDRAIDGIRVSDWFADSAGASSRSALRLISVGAAVILLVAVINAATLTLSRAEQRQRDVSIHRALGATRWRLLQRRGIEALLVAVPCAAAGLGLAAWTVPAVLAKFGESVPRAATISVDGISVAVAAVCGIAAAIVVAIASAAHTRANDAALRADTRTMTANRPTVRRVLVAVQVGLATTVLYGALVVGSTLWSLARVDLGVPTEHTMMFSVSLPQQRYASPAAVTAFFTNLESSLSAIPGVARVGITSRQPLAGGTNGNVSSAADPAKTTLTEWRVVSPSFFDALGLQIAAGRGFSEHTANDKDGVVISAALGRALFGETTAVGQQVVIDRIAPMNVIGVANDFRDFGPTRGARPTIYFRHGSRDDSFFSSGTMTVLLRGANATASLAPIRAAVRALDTEVPIDRPMTLAAAAERAQGVSRRAAGTMLMIFAAIAVALGSIGIGGVVAFNVQRRTREIGVRLALGSTPAAIMRSVLGEGLALAAAGAVIGISGAWWINRLVTSVVIESARPQVGAVMAIVIGALTLIALCACALPARRASKISVVAALRAE